MGMFDTIFCKKELPLNKELKALSVKWDEFPFQTKDLDNSLSEYRITEEGILVEKVIEGEYIPLTEEELKSKTRRPWEHYKDFVVTNEYDKKIEHHGIVNFYSDVDYTDEEDYWVEFNAYFIYGKLDRIELKECRKTKSQAVSYKEWEAKHAEELKKPWNKIKKALNYIGWLWFWRNIEFICHRLSLFFSNARMFIIRKML